jgi:hypothetical protein
MKKFLIFLIIIIILGAVVFYIGWVQFQVGEDEYGVVFTRTNGWDSEVIEPGVFNWRWEKLIPRNMTLHIFKIQPYSTRVQVSGKLPSGELYSEYLDGDVNLSYTMDVYYTFKIKPETLPELAAEENFTPESMEAWYQDFSESCSESATLFVRDMILSDNMASSGSIDLIEFEKDFFNRLSRQYSYVEFLTVSPREISLPDIDLYLAGKQTYFAIIEARERTLSESTIKATSEKIDTESQLEKLREYGKVLTEFPILLDYLALKMDTGSNPLELEEIFPLEIIE